MRVSVLPAVAVLSVGVIACNGEPLTGPDAQIAYEDAVSRYSTLRGKAVVFIDDRRMATGERLDQLDPKDVVRIEVLKGEAAARLYGNDARGGVIRVYTTRAPTPSPGQR